jgi:hypothetical protein
LDLLDELFDVLFFIRPFFSDLEISVKEMGHPCFSLGQLVGFVFVDIESNKFTKALQIVLPFQAYESIIKPIE